MECWGVHGDFGGGTECNPVGGSLAKLLVHRGNRGVLEVEG